MSGDKLAAIGCAEIVWAWASIGMNAVAEVALERHEQRKNRNDLNADAKDTFTTVRVGWLFLQVRTPGSVVQ